VNYLRFASRLESELDSLKQELCLRTDYSPLDHFRCIDINGKGYIRQSELGLFLREIDPSITSE
jgi:Ca2+-binding EF-hand superfamily protein